MTASETRKVGKPRCGLCGKTKNLTRTECCGNWICDDEHSYVMFSYADNRLLHLISPGQNSLKFLEHALYIPEPAS